MAPQDDPSCRKNVYNPDCEAFPIPTTDELGLSDGATRTVASDRKPDPTDDSEDTNTSVILTKSAPAPTTVMPTATSAPELQRPVSEAENNSLSAGAVAGIAVGSAVAGAAIAFLIAFLLFKRKGSKQPAKQHLSPYDSTNDLNAFTKSGGGNNSYVQVSQTPLQGPPIFAATTVAATPAVPAATQRATKGSADTADYSDFLANILPPAADEETVKTRVKALFNAIHRHVETYYRDVHASITQSMESNLERFGIGEAGIGQMLRDTSHPIAVIKHALVGYILGITGSKSVDRDETLFPKEILGIRSKGGPSDIADLIPAYVLHKRLSAYLYTASQPTSYTPTRNDATNPSSTSLPLSAHQSSLQSSIREAAEHFAISFFPWANPTSSDQEKDDELCQIMNNALELNIWLYGQPFTYEFVWEGVGKRGVVVAPGLVRGYDERRGERVIEPTVSAS